MGAIRKDWQRKPAPVSTDRTERQREVVPDETLREWIGFLLRVIYPCLQDHRQSTVLDCLGQGDVVCHDLAREIHEELENHSLRASTFGRI